jgi:hypothetical protein
VDSVKLEWLLRPSEPDGSGSSSRTRLESHTSAGKAKKASRFVGTTLVCPHQGDQIWRIFAIGRLLTLGSFLKFSKASKLRVTFSTVKAIILILIQHKLGLHFGRFFHKCFVTLVHIQYAAFRNVDLRLAEFMGREIESRQGKSWQLLFLKRENM